MTPLPDYRPRKTSLGPLEAEILSIIWDLGVVTVKDVHERILSDPDRELAYASVTTILHRLTQKGWLSCTKEKRAFSWRPLVSRLEAQAILAYEQLHNFLAVGNPDVVASFADSLDTASVEQLEAIAARIEAVRRLQQEK
ncbi:BlaI/MecI/CopY family transcriptional regulator [Gloeocapsa sp. PCC 73106]|uniref:BlaI/MecI/CopY family transcriptional regulator n=1 Tax=Gloeocapsa sp. PCC 73106 TaxID=102232 RepID=UPI0002AC0183|nr:BlaI/MecI/CopY family transcriptional regulator [Gloeocapsa sp. PCC 73106]ELR99266.1 putative transcriptional regulator [Gloeocapsa sp. PCC 73106]